MKENNLNENFVTYEIAVKLKEIGFKKKCYARYIENYLDVNSYHPNKELFDCYNEDPDLGRFYLDAPTISQALKWLRKEKKIHICIDIHYYGWFFDIVSFCKEDTGMYEFTLPYVSSNVTPDYDTYEQAALAGIKYVLDNLI